MDDLLMTNNTFGSERNDIKLVFTGSKFMSLTEDLLASHLKLCIHKVKIRTNVDFLIKIRIIQKNLKH